MAFLSGDKALCDFAREFIPGITTVAVNEGVGGATVSMHPKAAVKAIREAAEKAVKNAQNCAVPMPDRFDMVIRFREHQKAYSRSFYPGARLEDEKNVCFSAGDWFDVLRFAHFVF